MRLGSGHATPNVAAEHMEYLKAKEFEKMAVAGGSL